MSDSTFERHYRGRYAELYDERRTQSDRWQREIAAFDAMLEHVKPRIALDCPYGTGRWTESYRRHDVSVIGIDKSEDMLFRARQKFDAAERANFRLRQGDVFSDDLRQHGEVDLAVCVRFVNWISARQLARVLDQFRSLNARHMILGASVIPCATPAISRLAMRARLRLDNLKRRVVGSPLHWVHDEDDLLDALNRRGWRVIEQRWTARFGDRENYLYLLELHDE